MGNKGHKKICIVVSSLGKGGAERTSAMLSKMLYNLGCDVYLVSVLNHIAYDYAGTLFNLGQLKDKRDTPYGRYQRFVAFRRFLKNNRFDLIIDSRSKPRPIKELLIHSLLYKGQNLVHVIHSSNLNTYLPKHRWVFKLIFKKVKMFVCVSNDIKNLVEKTYRTNKISTIYNAVDIKGNERDAKEFSVMDFEYILYFGRLEDKVKNISLLIDAYQCSKLRTKDIKLMILGDGSDKSKLMEKVEYLKLEDYILFYPFAKNPFPYIKNAIFTVLTSRYEGFPMVVPESLSVGVPVISVDCHGPIEIIETGYNGILVENFKKEALAEAMDRFIFDREFYRFCKENSKKSIEKLSLENISKDWKGLIEKLL